MSDCTCDPSYWQRIASYIVTYPDGTQEMFPVLPTTLRPTDMPNGIEPQPDHIVEPAS